MTIHFICCTITVLEERFKRTDSKYEQIKTGEWRLIMENGYQINTGLIIVSLTMRIDEC